MLPALRLPDQSDAGMFDLRVKLDPQLSEVVKSSQVKSYSPGEHEGSAQRKPQRPARWGRVVGMHAAAPAALWAAWDEFTCAGAALLAALSL